MLLGAGSDGEHPWINPRARVVIVKLSSLPTALNPWLHDLTLRSFSAIRRAL